MRALFLALLLAAGVSGCFGCSEARERWTGDGIAPGLFASMPREAPAPAHVTEALYTTERYTSPALDERLGQGHYGMAGLHLGSFSVSDAGDQALVAGTFDGTVSDQEIREALREMAPRLTHATAEDVAAAEDAFLATRTQLVSSTSFGRADPEDQLYRHSVHLPGPSRIEEHFAPLRAGGFEEVPLQEASFREYRIRAGAAEISFMLAMRTFQTPDEDGSLDLSVDALDRAKVDATFREPLQHADAEATLFEMASRHRLADLHGLLGDPCSP